MIYKKFFNTFKFILIFISSIQSVYSTTEYLGPLVVDDAYIQNNGNVIIGNFSGTLTQPAITINTIKQVTIINSNLNGPSDLISAIAGNANLQVINTNGNGINPNVRGQAKGKFLVGYKVANLLVKNCTIQNVSMGVYINGFAGNCALNQTIKITNNKVKNIDGRLSAGAKLYLTTSGVNNSHAFQFNGVYNICNAEISFNEIINTPAESFTTDIINIFNSSGTSNNHINIHDNYLQGMYPVNPASDTSYAGGGIICDGQTNDLATATAYVDIYNNQVVATANYGIAIASGHNNLVYSNRVISTGTLANGKMYAMKHAVGIYNWNSLSQPSNVFFNNIVLNNNPVGLIRPDANSNPERSDWWLPGQTINGNNIAFLPNNVQAPIIADELAEYNLWLQKLKNSNQIIGNYCCK